MQNYNYLNLKLNEMDNKTLNSIKKIFTDKICPEYYCLSLILATSDKEKIEIFFNKIGLSVEEKQAFYYDFEIK